MATSYSTPRTVTDGLVLNLDAANVKSYPGSGTTWNDLSGNNNNASLVNGPVFNSSNNGSIQFDGIDDNATIPSSVGSMGTGNWTISYWWRSNGAQSNYTSILGQGFTFNPTPSNGAWTSKVAHTSGNVNFTYYNNGIVDNLSSTNPNDDRWHNLVTVRNGTSLIVYMDTISVLSITLPPGFSFGTGAITNVAYNIRDNVYAKGFLTNIIFYNRALSATEVSQNFNATRRRFGV